MTGTLHGAGVGYDLPEAPQIDPQLHSLTHSKDNLIDSSISSSCSKRTVSKTKNNKILHNSNDRSLEWFKNTDQHHTGNWRWLCDILQQDKTKYFSYKITKDKYGMNFSILNNDSTSVLDIYYSKIAFYYDKK